MAIDIDASYKKSMQELDLFFELNWSINRPKINIVQNRKRIDELKGHKTEDWVVGWVDGTTVYLLSPENFEQESNHKYSDEEYEALIKHELAHCFTNVFSHYSKKPCWLFEGISIYLSGQNRFRKKPDKLEKFLDFHDISGKGIYQESGFAVEYLVKEHGKDKLLTLLKKVKGTKDKESFLRLFKTIYGFELDYKNFN